MANQLNPVERELRRAVKFVDTRYTKEDRQEYLRSLLQEVTNKLDEDAYDALTDPAATWCQKAADAHNNRLQIPDFPGKGNVSVNGPVRAAADIAEPAEDGDDLEAADDDDAGDEADTGGPNVSEGVRTDTDDVDADADADADDDGEAEAEDDETDDEDAPDGDNDTADPGDGVHEAQAATADTQAEPDDEVEEQPKKKRRQAFVPKIADPKRRKSYSGPTRYDNLTGEKNRYGFVAGTKVDDVCKLMEHGCTARDIETKIGGKFYNAMKKLVEVGHQIEKLPGGVFMLTHKDDIGKKRPKAAPPEPAKPKGKAKAKAKKPEKGKK